ncbi:unnamed protein product [Protopolystoma xenopodis]|uniref:Cadherin domain-containing protein n=1 Tax=Protopolystoma xenopodis TaxID=117903 RepID=A0A448WBN2_9PLAT|nr:unnamed protein product [Protopolystoma xenopodis]
MLLAGLSRVGAAGDAGDEEDGRPERLTFYVHEEVPIGTYIGSLSQALLGLVSEAKSPTGHQLPAALATAWTGQVIVMTPETLVAVNVSSGELFTRTRIDRESMCSQSGSCCLQTPTSLAGTSEQSVETVGAAADDHSVHSPSTFYRSAAVADAWTADFMPGFHPDCSVRLMLMLGAGGDQPLLVELVVYVVDVNDHSPVWPAGQLRLEIPEHTPVGRLFQLPVAVDLDQGPEHTIRDYRLQLPTGVELGTVDAAMSSPFSLSARLVGSPVRGSRRFDLHLRVEADLDRESRASYDLVLIAVDGPIEATHFTGSVTPAGDANLMTRIEQKSTSRTGSLDIRVIVTDINDHAPVFLPASGLIVEVRESTPPGREIYRLVAKDADLNDQDRLTFRLGSVASKEVQRIFAVEAKTGAIKLRHSLDYETAGLVVVDAAVDEQTMPSDITRRHDDRSQRQQFVGYTLPVRVSDGAHVTETMVYFRLINVNDNPPTINLRSHLRRSASVGGHEFWLSESAAIGELVATLAVEDADERGRQAELPSDAGLTERGWANFSLRCRTNLPQFGLQALVTGPRVGPSAGPGVAAPFGNSAGVGSSSPVVGVGASGLLKLVTRQTLDRETRAAYQVSVECWDSGEPALSSRAGLTVRLEDENDSPPVFERAVFYGHLAEGWPAGTPILRVAATDADLGSHARLRYRLLPASDQASPTPQARDPHNEHGQRAQLSGQTSQTMMRPNGPTTPNASADSLRDTDFLLTTLPIDSLLSINEATGQITSQMVFDREAIGWINCTVIAIDNSRPPSGHDDLSDGSIDMNRRKQVTVNTATARVVIRIDDVNDCRPQFDQPSYEFTVKEGARVHTLVS